MILKKENEIEDKMAQHKQKIKLIEQKHHSKDKTEVIKDLQNIEKKLLFIQDIIK